MANTSSGSAAREKFDRERADRLTYWGTVHGASVAFFDQLADLDMTLYDEHQEGVWDVFGILHSMAHAVYGELGLADALNCEREVLDSRQLALMIDEVMRRRGR